MYTIYQTIILQNPESGEIYTEPFAFTDIRLWEQLHRLSPKKALSVDDFIEAITAAVARSYAAQGRIYPTNDTNSEDVMENMLPAFSDRFTSDVNHLAKTGNTRWGRAWAAADVVCQCRGGTIRNIVEFPICERWKLESVDTQTANRLKNLIDPNSSWQFADEEMREFVCSMLETCR